MKKIATIMIAAFMLLTARTFAATTTVVTAKTIGTDSMNVSFTKNTADTLNLTFLYCSNPSFTGIVMTYSYGPIYGPTGSYNTHTPRPIGTPMYMKIVAYDSSTHLYDTSNIKKMVSPTTTLPMILPNLDGFYMSSATDPGSDTVIVKHIVSYYRTPTLTYTLPKVDTLTGTTPVTTYDTSLGWGINDTLRIVSVSIQMHGYFLNDTVVDTIVTGSPSWPPFVNVYGYVSSTDTSIDIPLVVNIHGSPTAVAKARFRSTVGGVWTDSLSWTPTLGYSGPQYHTVHYHASLPAHTYYWQVEVIDTSITHGYVSGSYATLPTPPRHSLRDSVVKYDTVTNTFMFTQKYSNMVGHSSSIMSARLYGGGIISVIPHSVTGADTILSAFLISPTDTGLHGFFGWDTDDSTGLTVRSDTMWVRIYAAPSGTLFVDSLTKAVNTADTIRWTSTNAAQVWIGTTPVATNGKLAVIIHQDTTIYWKVKGFDGTLLLDSVFIHADSSGLDTPDMAKVQAVEVQGNVVKLFPNPSVNEVTITSLVPMHKAEIYDVAGRIILTCAPTGTVYKLHVGNLDNGVYILSVVDENNFTDNRRFVVQH